MASSSFQFHEFTTNLETSHKARYVEKCHRIGMGSIDPYNITTGMKISLDHHKNLVEIANTSGSGIVTETGKMASVPKVDSMDIVNYLVLTTSHYTGQQFKAYRSLDSFQYFVGGFVFHVGM